MPLIDPRFSYRGEWHILIPVVVYSSVTGFALAAATSAASETLAIKVGVLRETHSREALSILDIPAADDTLAGALMGAADNNTTGKFTGQSFEAIDEKLDDGADAATALDALLEKGARLVIADLSPERLLAASETARAKGALLLNVSATDERLREEECRANVVHVAPSRAMLADGLAQYLVWKQWRRWLLIKGSHPRDELLAQAYRAAAKKFGAKIVEERVYEDTGGGRRSDSGSVQTQRQMPTLTQNAPAYDALLAVDESEVFAGYSHHGMKYQSSLAEALAFLRRHV
jgi:ABC transporter substrate binding protein (PQQ-dependent alcohol dehydrogenase system)